VNIEFDVIVVGSGASGMMAAISAAYSGSSVVVLEKGERFGGSSSLSGGQIWIPNNHLQKEFGIKDTPELAYKYIRRISAERSDPVLIKKFVEKAPEAFEFLTKKTLIKPILRVDEPDYRPEIYGALRGGRTIDPGLFDGQLLGKDYRKILHNQQYHFNGKHLTSVEFERLMRGEKVPEIRERKESTLSLGEALVASLRKALIDLNIPLYLSCRATRLLFDKKRVYGIEAQKEERRLNFLCRKGVILAAGGFEWNLRMKRKYLEFFSENSAGCKTNTGDGIRMGIALGAATSLMDQAWWFTLIKKPNEERGYLSTSERTLPGSIIVNKKGMRFANEAMNYNDFVREMIRLDMLTYKRENIPAFLIFDGLYASKYPFLGSKKIPSWVKRDVTIEGLAAKLGISKDGLRKTTDTFNKDALKGKDTQFSRGKSFYDMHWGDRKAKNPTLFPIKKPPFFGVRVLAGDIGTKGGLLTNEFSQVLNSDFNVIQGLYAVGNNSSSVMGLGYAGSGATLGPCITFGYIAGIHVSQQDYP
jgi:3-oxosteroid 1-dehydrogenase